MIKLLKCYFITLNIIDCNVSHIDEIKDYKKLKKEFKELNKGDE